MPDRPGIPKSPAGVTVAWMRRVLAAGGNRNAASLKDVAIQPIGTRSGYVGSLLRCRLTYHEDAAGHSGGTPSPASVVVKLPSPNAKARRVSRALSLYKREYDFYSVIAPQARVSAPALLYGEFNERTRTFVLVLEDLSHMEFFDRFRVATVEQARTAVRAIARLHGQYWEKQDQPPLSESYQFASLKNRVLLHLAYLLSAPPVLKRFGHVFSDDTRRLFHTYASCLDGQFLDFAALPQTFVHGDYHLGNLVFAPGSADDMTIIDWQVCGVSCGMEDIATFAVTGLSVDMRRAIERDLLREYHGIVCDMGARDYTFEECWQTYRAYVLSRLVTLTVAAAVVETDDADATRAAEDYLGRLRTAIEDLGAEELLAAPPPLWSLSKVFAVSSSLAYRIGGLLR